jgi:hypothetical protein
MIGVASWVCDFDTASMQYRNGGAVSLSKIWSLLDASAGRLDDRKIYALPLTISTSVGYLFLGCSREGAQSQGRSAEISRITAHARYARTERLCPFLRA